MADRKFQVTKVLGLTGNVRIIVWLYDARPWCWVVVFKFEEPNLAKGKIEGPTLNPNPQQLSNDGVFN